MDSGGTRQVLAEAEQVLDPLLSADWTTIAWTEHNGTSEGDEFAVTVVVADAATGEIRSRSRLDPSNGYFQAEAFLGDDLVLGGNGARDGAGLLDPRTGEVTPWLDGTGVLAVSPGGDLAAAHSPADGDAWPCAPTSQKGHRPLADITLHHPQLDVLPTQPIQLRPLGLDQPAVARPAARPSLTDPVPQRRLVDPPDPGPPARSASPTSTRRTAP